MLAVELWLLSAWWLLRTPTQSPTSAQLRVADFSVDRVANKSADLINLVMMSSDCEVLSDSSDSEFEPRLYEPHNTSFKPLPEFEVPSFDEGAQGSAWDWNCKGVNEKAVFWSKHTARMFDTVADSSVAESLERLLIFLELRKGPDGIGVFDKLDAPTMACWGLEWNCSLTDASARLGFQQRRALKAPYKARGGQSL